MNWVTTIEEAFAQGARCGHLEGKDRVGVYVLDEEVLASEGIADDQGLPSEEMRLAWRGGYQLGYKLAACGEALPEEYREPWLR